MRPNIGLIVTRFSTQRQPDSIYDNDNGNALLCLDDKKLNVTHKHHAALSALYAWLAEIVEPRCATTSKREL